MRLILTPCHDSKLSVMYADSLVNTLLTVPDVRPLWLPGESIVQKARNELFHAAYMDPAVDTILWIDADEAWQPQAVTAILADERDFVTGLVRQKTEGGRWCIRNPDEKTKTVESCGMGFCKMSRKVMDQLWRRSRAYTHNGVEYRSVFEVELVGGELVSEDVAACKKWRGKIYYRDDVFVDHIGQKIY
jgi:hypothetical protein